MTPTTILLLAQRAGETVLIMSIILIGLTAILRYQAIRNARRRLPETWGVQFAHPTTPLKSSWLPIPTADQIGVLSLWNQAYDQGSTDHKRKLEQLAVRVSLEHMAMDHLTSPDMDTQLLCIVTLGRLRIAEAWPLLEPLPADPNPVLSFAATRALFAINPDQAAQRYIRFLFRPDWSATKVAECLQEVEETVLAQVFIRWLRQTRSIPQAIRLIRYLGATRCVPALPDLRLYLDAPGRDPRILAEGLHTLSYFQSQEDHSRYRAATGAAEWYLRVRGAIGLGLVGSLADLPVLTPLLHDAHWWVRYRAAEAMTHLQGLDESALQALLHQETDTYGHNALQAFLTAEQSTSKDSHPSVTTKKGRHVRV